jgi:2-iminobutanoate/2-iminopropanoate deaminase
MDEDIMSNLKKEVIIPVGGAKPLAPYSPGIRLGDLVFTSGQIGLDPTTGSLVPGGVEVEARQALVNLQTILNAAGSSMEQVLKVTVYLKNIGDYGKVNKVYADFFQQDPPARAIVQGDLPAGATVEFDAVAVVAADS